MPRPRVFISSVVEGFEEFRAAARHGVEDADGEPVLVNEDFPALSSSPRNACLDGVASCDAYMCIVGARGGWTAPSGKLVTEEEYEQAVKLGIPVLVFVQDTNRDAEAKRLSDRLSSYTDGRLRSAFTNAVELRAKVAASVRPVIRSMSLPMTPQNEFSAALKPSNRHAQDAFLGLVIGPERQEEVIDPLLIGDLHFQELVMRIGHEPDVRLLDYRFPKEQTVTRDSLITQQDGGGGAAKEALHVRFEMSPRGRAVFESNVSGRVRASGADLLGSMVVAEEDIAAVAASMLRFYGRLFDEIDKFGRHQTFLMNAALFGLGYRSIARSPKPRQSYPVRMASGDGALQAFDEPRRVTRALLSSPEEEATRIATMLARRAAQ